MNVRNWSTFTVAMQMKYWRKTRRKYFFEFFFPYTEKSIKGKNNQKRQDLPQKENSHEHSIIPFMLDVTSDNVIKNFNPPTRWQFVWEKFTSTPAK